LTIEKGQSFAKSAGINWNSLALDVGMFIHQAADFVMNVATT
jgi:hypothetical protein